MSLAIPPAERGRVSTRHPRLDRSRAAPAACDLARRPAGAEDGRAGRLAEHDARVVVPRSRAQHAACGAGHHDRQDLGRAETAITHGFGRRAVRATYALTVDTRKASCPATVLRSRTGRPRGPSCSATMAPSARANARGRRMGVTVSDVAGISTASLRYTSAPDTNVALLLIVAETSSCECGCMIAISATVVDRDAAQTCCSSYAHPTRSKPLLEP